MAGNDGKQAYADGIGVHTPKVLDSCAGLALMTGQRFAEGTASVSWPDARRTKFVRVRNPRPFMPSHGYVFAGSTGIDNWCVAIYEEQTLSSGVRRLVRIGTTDAAGAATPEAVAFAPITMTKGLDVGSYVIALQCTTTASSVRERRTGESIDFHLRNLGYVEFTPSAFPLAITHGYGSGFTPGHSGLSVFGVLDRLF